MERRQQLAGGSGPDGGRQRYHRLDLHQHQPTGYTATNDLGSPFILNGLTFAERYGYGSGTSATQVTVASATNNSLRLAGASGASITLQSTANARVTSALELAAPAVTVSGPGSGNFVLLGSLTGTGQLVVNRQGAAAVGQTIPGGSANNFSGGVSLQSGALSFASAANLGNTSGLIIAPGGTLQNTGVVTLNQPVTIAAGGGTRGIDTQADLTLGGTNTFNGQLVINAGVVRVNGSLAQINDTDAGLGGGGLIARDVQLATGASLLAGAGRASIGRLTLAGNIAMELKVGTAAGDRVSVQGALAFGGGTATLRLTDLTGNGMFAGPYTFLSTDSGIMGTLPTLVLDYTNAPAFANAGLQVVQVGNTFAVVPEPSVNALLALAFGAGAVLFFLRRRLRFDK